MRLRTCVGAMAAAVAVLAIGAGPAAAQRAEMPTAPSSCRLFNPLFQWEDGQTRSLKAADNHCDTAPGRRAWLVFQRNGNLAFYLDGHQLWDAGTKGRGNKLVERGYGGLDIVDSNGQVLWSTGAPGASGFEPHPNGGYGVGFESDGDGANNAFTHWDQSEGLCGPGGACGETLWVSGKGTT